MEELLEPRYGNERTSLADVPVEIISKVIDYLPLKDKYHVSVTCRHFQNAFNNSQSWRTLELVIDPHKYISGSRPRMYALLLSKFGKYIKNLTITVNNVMVQLTEWAEVILNISKACRLRHVTLQIDRVGIQVYYDCDKEIKENIAMIFDFMENLNASNLRSVTIRSWLLDERHQITDLFGKLKKCRILEKLVLLTPISQGFETQMVDLVKHLTNLTEIELYVSMVTSDLIAQLSLQDGRKFTRMILNVKSNCASVAEIDSSLWEEFKHTHPSARVEFNVIDCVDNNILDKVFFAKCPVTNIAFLKESKCNGKMINSITSKYSSCLQSFITYCSLPECNIELIRLARQCQRLHTVIIGNTSGNDRDESVFSINFKTIETMAAVLGNSLKVFQVHELFISFVDINQVEHEAFDTVVSWNQPGFSVQNLNRYKNDLIGNERMMKIHNLQENVAKLIGSENVYVAIAS